MFFTGERVILFFFSLENQIFFIFSFVFSAYFFFNSILTKFQNVKVRALGLNFIIPLVSDISAFLLAPFYKSETEKLLLLGHLVLTVLVSFVLMLKETENLKMYYPVPFIAVGFIFLYAGAFDYERCFTTFLALNAILILTDVFMVFYSFFSKNKNALVIYFGLFLMSVSTGVWLLTGLITIPSVILMSSGLLLCGIYIYQNTLYRFYKEYAGNIEKLRRVKSSVENEVTRK